MARPALDAPNHEFVQRQHREYEQRLLHQGLVAQALVEAHGDVRHQRDGQRVLAQHVALEHVQRHAGQPRREDYEYTRAGKCSVFLAVEPLAGFRKVWVSPRRTKLDFAAVVQALVDAIYPEAEKLILVTDNLNIHHPAALYERFTPAEARRLSAKIEWHYTPEHGSWLNMAEIELSVLGRQCLHRRIPDPVTLATEVAAWEADRNARAATIDWRFTTTDARIKLKHLYPPLSL